MDEEDRNMFLKYCSNLLEAKTIPQYQLICGLLSKYTKKYPQVQLKLNWWHVCSWHVFSAFCTGPTHYGVNLVEIGNKKWKTTGSNLSLLAVAKYDLAWFFLQDEDIQQYRSLKLAVRGRGPTDIEIAALERKKQEEETQGLVQIIKNRKALKAQLQAENDPEYFLPGNKSNHKPPKRTTAPEGVAVDEDGQKRKGRGKKSRIPNVTELATHILEADKIVGKEKMKEM